MMESFSEALQRCSAIQFHVDYDKIKTHIHNLTHRSMEGTISLYDVSSTYDRSEPRSKPMDLTESQAPHKVIAQLQFTCSNRYTGDLHFELMSCAELSPGTVLAQMTRSKGPNLFHDWEKEIPILIHHDHSGPIEFAKYYPSIQGNQERLVLLEDKTEFSRMTPFWQDTTKALCCAFLLFFPTFAIGSCIMFCIASKSAIYSRVYCKKGNVTTRLQDYALKGDALLPLDTGLSTKDKIGLILYGCAIYLETVIQPPRNNQV